MTSEMQQANKLRQEFKMLLMNYLRVRDSQNELSKQSAESILTRAREIDVELNALIDAGLIPAEYIAEPPLNLWQEKRPFAAYYEPLNLNQF